MRRLGSKPHQKPLPGLLARNAWVAAAIARFAAPVVIATATLFLASALPAAEAKTATLRSCVGALCVALRELPGDKVSADFYSSSIRRPFELFNVRFANGTQIEICGSCSWTFSVKPGASYTFSAQGCITGDFLTAGVHFCGGNKWSVFHYTAPKADVQSKQEPVIEAPQVVPLPGKGKKSAGDYAVKEVEALPGKGKKDAGDYVLKDPAGKQAADLTVVSLKGPGSLQAGLSGTYTVTIQNVGKASANVELAILFAKTLNQTGQIVAGAGLACALVGHAAAINAQVNCTGGQLAAGEIGTVTVQGRGQTGGLGLLIGTLNNSRSLQEDNYDNNVKQIPVTIN